MTDAMRRPLQAGDSPLSQSILEAGLPREILEHLPAAIYMTDAEGRIIFYNRAAAELAGRQPKLGKDKWCVSWRLRRPDGSILPHDECPMAKTLKSGLPVLGEEALAERPDGSLVPFLACPTPLFSPAGELTGAINMLVDLSERRRAETAMRDQSDRFDALKNRLAAIVEYSNDAIISMNLEGKITTWNKGAERTYGYSAEEAIGQPITSLAPAEHFHEEPAILRRIGNGEHIEHYETKRRRKDGTIIDVSLTVSPVRNPRGDIIGASKIARDVTGRKQAEAALARGMNEQAALHEFTARLHRANSLEGVYQAALDAIVRALGCDRASLLLFDEQDVMRFVAWRGLSEDYRRALDGHSPWTKDSADPTPIFIEDTSQANLPKQTNDIIVKEGIGALGFVPLVTRGYVVGKFMTYYDRPHEFTGAEIDLSLTIARQLGFSIDRIRAEEVRRRFEDALRESEQRLQMALMAGRMGAWEWDIASGHVIWSPGLEELHGLQTGSLGGTFEDFKRNIHPDDLDTVEARIEETLRTGQDYHVAYRVDHPSGTARWLEAFGRLTSPTTGSSIRVAGVCMDITERKQAELQRDLLVAELSHRVKNTLATVIAIARQSFATNPDPVEAQRSFNARIRALGQTHSRLAETNWSGVSLETILLDELAPYRHERQSNISVSGPDTTLTPKQALTIAMAAHELATNAAKYGGLSHRGGRVEVVWTKSEGQLHLKWCETGGPNVVAPTRYGFGRMLLERIVAADLGGVVRIDFASGGLCCEIDMPLQRR